MLTEPTMPRAVSLTFDDGPDPHWTPRVHAELERLGVHATFFVIGERAVRHPEIVKASAQAGHEVELHCHRHVRHDQLDEAELRRDTEQALQTLEGLGILPRLWRAPWGVTTQASRSVARRFGLRLVGWSIDTHDWRGDEPESMLAAAAPELLHGGAVLMHDGLGPGAKRSGCENTLALLGPLSARCCQLGVELDSLRASEAALAR